MISMVRYCNIVYGNIVACRAGQADKGWNNKVDSSVHTLSFQSFRFQPYTSCMVKGFKGLEQISSRTKSLIFSDLAFSTPNDYNRLRFPRAGSGFSLAEICT